MDGKDLQDFNVKDLQVFKSSDNSGRLNDNFVDWGFKILCIDKSTLYLLNLGLTTLTTVFGCCEASVFV